MTKEDVKFRLELLDMEIKANKEVYDFNKNANRVLAIAYGSTVLGTTIALNDVKNFGVLQILSISVLGGGIHYLLSNIINDKNRFKHKDEELKIKKMYYQSVLMRGEVK